MMRLWIFPLVLVLGVTSAVAQGGDAERQKAAAAAQAQQGGMMEYAKHAMPGDHHEHLSALAGDWDYSMTVWQQPGGDPVEAQGTVASEVILGGRFLRSTYRGELMGQPFEGIAIDGYDNQAGEYVGTWRDTMATNITLFKGHCAADGKVRTMRGELPGADGAPVVNRGVTTLVDENTYRYESYLSTLDGTEFKNMVLVATRRAG